MAGYVTIEAQALTQAIAAIVAAGGSEGEEPLQVAGSLVGANLAGHDSHGVGMIPRYVDALLEGGLLPNRQPSIKLDAGALLVDQPVRAALSNKETNYFMIEGLNSCDLVYKKLSGDFNPEVSLHILGDNEMLEQVGSLYGPYIASGTLGINDRSLSNHLYLVIVREQTYSYSFDEVTADYTLTLVEP